jgi:hypothetical protein
MKGRSGPVQHFPWIGEVDRAVRFHHHVVRPVEAPALEARRYHCGGTVGLFTYHPPSGALASDKASLEVASEPVCSVSRFLEFDRPLTGCVFHASIAIDVAEQKVAALLPPQRTLGRPSIAADAIGKSVNLTESGN